jgi:Ca2+-binding RTX toxin-like protein
LDGDDTIVGFGGTDAICGGIGDDGIAGGRGRDVLLGGPGADTFLGGPGADVIRGGSGFDVIEPEGGNDIAMAGPGGAVIAYLFARGGVTVDLRNGTSRGADGSDRLTGFTAVFGSEHRDSLRGSRKNDDLVPFDGNDRVNGRGGLDAVYFFESLLSESAGAVSVDLRLGKARGEGRDLLAHLEAVYGTPFGDTIRGDRFANFLDGAAGDDWVDGRGGANDLYGEAGTDTCLHGASYVSCENQGADVLPLPPLASGHP